MSWAISKFVVYKVMTSKSLNIYGMYCRNHLIVLSQSEVDSGT